MSEGMPDEYVEYANKRFQRLVMPMTNLRRLYLNRSYYEQEKNY